MLQAENEHSVRFRYDDRDVEAELYEHPSRLGCRLPYVVTPVEGLAAIACYEYQSCEHPEWRTSEARRFCQALKETLIRGLPGYEQAPWHWTINEVLSRSLIA